MRDLTKETYFEAVKNGCCLVLFSKETCPLCQEVHPLVEEIEEEYEGKPIQFLHVDGAVELDLMKELLLQGVPTTLLYRDGELYQKFTGFREYDELTFLIDRMIDGK